MKSVALALTWYQWGKQTAWKKMLKLLSKYYWTVPATSPQWWPLSGKCWQSRKSDRSSQRMERQRRWRCCRVRSVQEEHRGWRLGRGCQQCRDRQGDGWRHSAWTCNKGIVKDRKNKNVKPSGENEKADGVANQSKTRNCGREKTNHPPSGIKINKIQM